MSVALRPIVRDSTITDAKLAAGPAISKTNATPGLRPLSISDIAIGIDPVAHTYMGTATSIMTPIARRGYRLRLKNSWSGTSTVIRAAMTRPITSHLPTLATISTSP